MKVTFLGQGLESESKNAIGHYLIEYLNSDKFYSFTAISAFASQFAIGGIKRQLQKAKNKFNKITIIVGVDQEGTSKEALESILSLNVDSYIFYQSESVIFHPKIYLFEGDNEVKLIIGSSNLTGTGLFRNVESSLLVEYTNDDSEGANLIADLKEYYKSLLDFSDRNLNKITSHFINEFVLAGIIPDEQIRKQKYREKTDITGNGVTIDIHKRPTAKISYSFYKSIESESAAISIDLENVSNANLSKQLKTANSDIKILFVELYKRIKALDDNNRIEEKFNTNNTVFKITKVFAEVKIQTDNLLIRLKNIEHDLPENMIIPVPKKRNWGNKIGIRIKSEYDLDYFMPLIKKSYNSTRTNNDHSR